MSVIKPVSSKEIDNRPWTSQDIGQNSIHSIMNDPNGSSKMLQLPVQTLAIPKTQLKAHRFKDFAGYIKDIESIYQQYQIMIQTETDDSFLYDHLQEEYRDVSKLKNVKLDQVDGLFFKADFDLKDPKVFDLITSHKNVTSANLSIGSDSNYNQVLQEQLSHQLDTVEVHLVKEISQRSHEFFSALTNIQSLHESTLQCLVYLRKIRSTLKVVDSVNSQQGLMVVDKQKLVDNLQKIVVTIEKIKEVKKTQPNIQILLNQGDYISALDLIENALHGQTQLQQIKSLQNLSGQLQEMSKVIGNLMENDFVTILGSDQDTQFTLYERWSKDQLLGTGALNSGVANLIDNESALKEKLTPLVTGLIKIDRFSAALQMYRDRLMKTIKSATKQFFPPPLAEEKLGAGSDDGRTTDNVLAKRFRVLTFDKFYDLLVSVYSTLMMHLRRINVVVVLMNQIVKRCEGEGSQPGQKTKFTQALNETADILYAAADLAHVRCGKLLTLRSEQNSQLNIKDFFRLFDLSWRFVQSGEEMAQRTCIGLRGVLMSQTKSFVTFFHMERMKQIAMLVDNELWVPAEVPIEFQVLLNNITGDPLKAIKQQPRGEDDPTPKANMQSYLSVGILDYNVVSCVPMFIKMVDEYLACVHHVPTIAADVLNRIVELSKFFNNRICGVIVGGAAVQSTVLKSITAKHLALAGQSLGFMVAVLPFIKAKVQEHLPIKQQALANDFDNVVLDYQNNQKQVFSRVVMIMEERINAHADGIKQVLWDAPYTQEDPSPWVKSLVKETQKLHKILAKYLFTDSMRSIFRDVFAAYNKKLELELSRLDIYSPQAKSRMLVDVQFYITQLTALENVDAPGNQLEVVVNNVRIRDESERPPKPVEKPKPVSLAVSSSAALDANQQKKSGFGFSTSFSGFNKFMSGPSAPQQDKK